MLHGVRSGSTPDGPVGKAEMAEAEDTGSEADEPKQVVAGDWLKKEIPRRIEEAEAAGAPLPIFTGMMNAFLGKGK